MEYRILNNSLKIGFYIFFMSTSQLLLKISGTYSATHLDLLSGWVFNPWLCISIIILILGTYIWILILQTIPLSMAYPWTALIYILTPFGSMLFFNESLSLRYGMGMILIFLGIIITSCSTLSGTSDE